MSSSFEWREPQKVTMGALGPPGQRVFYLQARQGHQLVSLKLEKQQVAFLTGGLREVLADLASASASLEAADVALEEPVEPQWAIGSLELAYDPSGDRIVLTASEVGSEVTDDDADEPVAFGPEGGRMGPPPEAEGAKARLEITREQAAVMIEAGKRLLRSGRPPCPLCGFPLSDDHSCPKTNGHRAPSL